MNENIVGANNANGNLSGDNLNAHVETSDDDEGSVSQIDIDGDQDSLKSYESDDSADGVSIGHPNTPVNGLNEDESLFSDSSSNDSDSEDMSDSRFGGSESNGEGDNSNDPFWSASETDIPSEPASPRQNALENRDSQEDNESVEDQEHNEGGMQPEWENLVEAEIDNDLASNAMGRMYEQDRSEWEVQGHPVGYNSLIPRSNFMNAIIMENTRTPPGFDPEMVFDDSDNNQGSFSVPGQIWEDLSSDELSSTMVAQMPLDELDYQALSPVAFEDYSDENKENMAPETNDHVNTDSNVFDEDLAEPGDTSGHGRLSHNWFGPLRPLRPWDIA